MLHRGVVGLGTARPPYRLSACPPYRPYSGAPLLVFPRRGRIAG